MRGIVEIYSVENDIPKLVYSENNLIVDGAGKTIVDALTTFDGVSGISNGSAILNASNYTIQAITFGAPSSAYLRNIHSTTYPLLVSGLSNTRLTVLRDGVTSTTFSPDVDTPPKYPNPIDQKLELSASPSGSWSGITVRLPYTTSAGIVIEDQGHHLNIGSLAALYNQFGVSAPLSILFGTYGFSGAGNSASAYLVSSINQLDPNTGYPSSIVASANLAGFCYNARQLIDYHGFINMISPSANSNINFTGTTAGTTGSGLQLSAQNDFSSTGELVYGTKIAIADIVALNINGGVYNMGLWTIDLNKSIQAGNFPPYSFSQLNNPRKYRLFCKKTFNKNVVEIGAALTTAAAMQIVWRIKFL